MIGTTDHEETIVEDTVARAALAKIRGQASAFDLLGSDADLEGEIEAAKATGRLIRQTADDALCMLRTPPGLDEMAVRADERQQTEAWICQRLASWLAESPRMPAASAFTAGPMRDLARTIETILRKPGPRV